MSIIPLAIAAGVALIYSRRKPKSENVVTGLVKDGRAYTIVTGARGADGRALATVSQKGGAFLFSFIDTPGTPASMVVNTTADPALAGALTQALLDFGLGV